MENRTIWTIVIAVVVLGLLACCCIGLLVPAAFTTFRTTAGVTEFRVMPGVTTVRGTGQIVERAFPLGDVNRVHLTGSADVTVQLGTAASIQIQAEENIIDLVEWEERNRSVVIGMRPNVRIIRDHPIRVTVTVPELVAITSAGSGDIVAPDMMSDTINIHVMGSGDVNVDYVEAQTVEINLNGSGDISLLGVDAEQIQVRIMGSGWVRPGDGTVNAQDITISGSGSYQAESLESARVSANLMGSGSARVRVSDELSARLAGSGNLEYIGSPSIDSTVLGSGRLRQVGQ